PRLLAVIPPEAVFENTRVETTIAAPAPSGALNTDTSGQADRDGAEHVFCTRGKVLLVPGWRGVYEESSSEERARSDEDEGADEQLPRLSEGESVDTLELGSARKETKPP